MVKDATKNGKNYVYFIYEGYPNNLDGVNIFKMGFSVDPNKRILNLQTGNMRQLSIYRVIECPNRKFARAIEYVLHKNYISYNNRGEWFHISPQEIDKTCGLVIDMISSGLPLEYFEEIPMTSESESNMVVSVGERSDGVEVTICANLPDNNFGNLVQNLRLNLGAVAHYHKHNDVSMIIVEGNYKETIVSTINMILDL